MKKKTIEKVLKGVFNSWVKSIKDESLKRLVKRDTIITGGSIVSLLTDEKVNDFDLYFKTLKTTEAVAKYYVERYLNIKKKSNEGISTPISVKVEEDRVRIVVKSSGIDAITSDDEGYRYFEGLEPGSEEQAEFLGSAFDPDHPESETFVETALNIAEHKQKCEKYDPVMLTDNAISLKGDIQLIIRFYGDADEIHENYDFVHCTNYWESDTGKLHLRKVALESILTKELIYTGSLYPICSMIRARKFIRRGWSINAGQYLKMAFQINELILKDVNVLREQLIGVDVAYFRQLLSMIETGREGEIDAIYISELVDRLHE